MIKKSIIYKKSLPAGVKRKAERDEIYYDIIVARYQELGSQATSYTVFLGQAALAYCVALGVILGLLMNVSCLPNGKYLHTAVQ